MPSFGSYSTILPTPVDKIGLARQVDAAGYAGPGFASLKLKSVEHILSSKHPSNTVDRQRAANFHKWEVEISYNPLECSAFHTVYGFLLHRQMTMQPFYVLLPQYTNQNIANKSVTVAGGWGFNTITVDGTGVTPGAMFSYNNKVYVVTRVENETNYYSPLGAPASGDERLHVSPSFQESILFGSTLNFQSPMIYVMLSDSSLDYSVNDKGLFSFAVSLEEAKI